MPEQINQQNNEELFVIRDIVLKYLRKWYWFVLSVVVCLLIASLYLKTQAPKYSVKTTILIRQENSHGGNAGEMGMLKSLGMATGDRWVDDEIYIINSASLMRQVIQTLNLQTDYYQRNRWRYVEQYPNHSIDVVYPLTFGDTIRSGVRFDIVKRDKDYKVKLKYGHQTATYYLTDLAQPVEMLCGTVSFKENKPLEEGDKYRIVTSTMPSLVGRYNAAIKAEQPKQTNVVNITTTSATPRKAMDMLDKLVELYNMDAVVDKNLLATATARFIDERLAIITDELSDVEQNVESYKRSHQLTDIASEADLYLKTSSDYQKELAKIETQLNLTAYVQEYVQDDRNKYSLIPANLGIDDRSLGDLVKSYNEVMMERMRMLRSTNESNPVLIQLDQQLSSMRESILESVKNIRESLNISRNDAISRDRQFINRIKNVPTQEREYVEIKRQQQIKETLYLYLFQKREENALNLASTVQPAKTIDKADYGRAPVSPRRMIILLAALIIGLCIPIAVMFIYDLIYDQIVDKKEFETKLKTPFLGEISESKSDDRLVVAARRTSSIAELFRLLRTNLNFILQGKQSPVIVVTSSYTGEGKSFISINLAASLALMNKKVLIIGLDVRNPKLSAYLELGHAGHFTEYLAGADIDDSQLIYRSKAIDTLDVVPAGPVPPNPGELMLSSRLDDVIARWRTAYDYVIIDSAPVGVVSDTYLLNRLSDMTIYVSRAHYTPRSTVDFINEQFEQQKLNNMACVLNGVDRKSVYGGYYYYGSHRKASKYYSYYKDED